MAARESAPKAGASTPADAPAEGPTAEELAVEAATAEAEPEREETAAEPEPAHAPEPIRRYVAPRPTPYRAGGHVLTERGWVLDTNQEA